MCCVVNLYATQCAPKVTEMDLGRALGAKRDSAAAASGFSRKAGPGCILTVVADCGRREAVADVSLDEVLRGVLATHPVRDPLMIRDHRIRTSLCCVLQSDSCVTLLAVRHMNLCYCVTPCWLVPCRQWIRLRVPQQPSLAWCCSNCNRPTLAQARSRPLQQLFSTSSRTTASLVR